jgi:ABC-type methionine transport system ATPase subunit
MFISTYIYDPINDINDMLGITIVTIVTNDVTIKRICVHHWIQGSKKVV